MSREEKLSRGFTANDWNDCLYYDVWAVSIAIEEYP
jgi:hypothetical protein